MPSTITLPNYRTNSSGHLVPLDAIKPLDLLRDDTVRQIIASAQLVQDQMTKFKAETMSDIDTFLSISAEQYGAKMGGKKGNIQLVSFDGRHKVIVQVSDTLQFDERLQIAKQLIDECIHEWVKDSGPNIQTLIENAFQTDKQGNINKGRIFSLMRVKIDDEKWVRAMEALKDSLQPAGSSQYLRLYQRVDQTDQYKQISLDMAGL
jgi:hypothetical protein